MTIKQLIEAQLDCEAQRDNTGNVCFPRLSMDDLKLLRSLTFMHDAVLQGEKVLFGLERRYAKKKVNGMYKNLKTRIFEPTPEWLEKREIERAEWAAAGFSTHA